MKKIIPLSIVAVLSLSAAEIELETIGVESTYISEVAQNAETSADVAEALSSRVPSIDMNRRSGIANDIHIRGQKRDNISIEVDGTKVHGACPNRMDPPTSHILANQINEVEVIEGPYDVETFGVLSGGVKITTKKPSKEFKGQVDIGLGSFGYQKIGATVSGGNDTIRVLLTGSRESSEQYKDGDSNTLAQQLKNNPSAGASVYQAQYENIDAYEKKSLMAKAFVNVAENHELRLSYTANRSDNILYANSKMDAAYDDSNIYNVEYNIANLSDYSKNLTLQYYYSDVDHPMDTKYRQAAVMMGSYMTNQLQTTMEGLKLKNQFNINDTDVLVGLDQSTRTWVGEKFMTNNTTGMRMPSMVSLTDTETKNQALFTKITREYGNLKVAFGARYDATDITPAGASFSDRSYNALSANILTSYKLDKISKLFVGIGKSSRVPDARELYMGSIANGDLEQTTNKEIDLGYELNNDTISFKVKAFYSMLDDYIYFNNTAKKFNNVDAKIYGTEVDAEFYINDMLTADASASYKRGKRNNSLSGQTGTNLADITPLRATLGTTYEYANNSSLRAEIVTSDRWNNFDSENGEQELAGWSIVNLKAKHSIDKKLILTLGVNNLFDATYAQSNTYADLILLSTGINSDVMLLNEPGRYLYTNLTYKF